MKVNIHNQCSNTKLVSPIYFGNGVVHPKLSDRRIDIGTRRKACFEINATQNEFKGVFLFKLKKKNRLSIYSSNLFKRRKYSNSKAKCVQMLIAWKVKNSKLFLYVALVKHPKGFTWNEDYLKKLYDKNHDWLKEYNSARSDTWLMDGDIVLKTTVSVRDLKEIIELNISISKGEKSNFDMKPLDVNLKR
jgi:hypothetical protein